jgi:hypothetical protein
VLLAAASASAAPLSTIASTCVLSSHSLSVVPGPRRLPQPCCHALRFRPSLSSSAASLPRPSSSLLLVLTRTPAPRYVIASRVDRLHLLDLSSLPGFPAGLRMACARARAPPTPPPAPALVGGCFRALAFITGSGLRSIRITSLPGNWECRATE